MIIFVEKPCQAKAEEYIGSGGYLWNSGMFIFRLSAALGMFLRHMPDMYSSMQPLAEKLGTSEEEPLLGEIYPCLERISFDYGIMEKERNISVIPGDFGWSDIGAWNTLDDIMPADEQQNIIRADHLGIDTTGCVIFSDDNRLIATLGITDLVIVSTGDSLLICPRDRAQEIRKLTDLLEKHNRRDLL
jgi:mannose-1-phosphate guanylyltransferase